LEDPECFQDMPGKENQFFKIFNGYIEEDLNG